MKKHAATLAAMFFVCGVVIVPALHQAGLCFPHSACGSAAASHDKGSHGGDSSCPAQHGHSADTCPICQLAATPTMVSYITVQPATCHTAVQLVAPANLPFSASLDSHPFLARGPPVLLSI